jgi:signal transduction histidine kinase
VYLLLALLLLLAIAFVFYRHRSRQRLQLMQLQYKISQDLHDDVGSSLSSLQVYSTVAGSLVERDPAKAREMLQKITKESTVVMENIGDIVWSMKTATEQSLEERIRNFAADVLGAAGIRYTLHVEPEIESILRNFEARKNILLLIKEAVTNCVKFSQASLVSITIKRLAGQLCVQISDNGQGFRNTEHFEKNKGLYNMRQRTRELEGIFELSSTPGKGTTIAALIPLTKISDQR